MTKLACFRCGEWDGERCACKDGQTIFHGDCRDVLPQLRDGIADMIWTDPPYGHNNNNNGDLIHRWEAALGSLPSDADSPPDARPIANDDSQSANDLARWAFGEFPRLLHGGCCCCCCCCGGGPDPQFARWSLWLDDSLEFKQMVVWDKGPIGMGWHYRRSYETVLVAQKPGAACKWYANRSDIENIIRPTHGWAPKIIPSKTDHPTPKPVGLAEWFIGLHTKAGEIVLDPFAGGGPALEASKRLGRRCIAIELEEKYCEIAANRLRQEVLF